MNKITVDILNLLGGNVLEQLNNKKSKKKYLDVDTVRHKLKEHYQFRRVTNAFYYLARRKYIQYKQEDGHQKLVLTTQGAMQYIKYCDLTNNVKLTGNKQSLVVVEVPENMREIRDFLRRRLTKCGFSRISRGVYVSRYKLSPNLKLMSRLYGLEKSLFFGEFKKF